MALNNLVKTTTRSAKRVGRGIGSGKGKTAGRGTKGQKSRSGHNIPRRFQGGETSMIQRLPKARGFKSRFAKPAIVNLIKIEIKFNDGDEVNLKTLLEKNLIKKSDTEVKIIGAKVFTKNLKFRDVVFSRTLAEAHNSSIKSSPLEGEEKGEVKDSAEVLKPAKISKAKATPAKTEKTVAKKTTTKKSK